MSDPFRIVLNEIDRLPSNSIVVSEIARVYVPIAKQAGRALSVERNSLLPENQVRADITVTFEYNPAQPFKKLVQAPTGVVEFFGNGDGTVFVYALRDHRLGGGRRPFPNRQGGPPTDYYSQIQRVLDTDLLVAKAVANTAVHELGHMIAKLDHTSLPSNFMYSGRQASTLSARQMELAGTKSFNGEQIRKLVEAIRSGKLGDDVKTIDKAKGAH